MTALATLRSITIHPVKSIAGNAAEEVCVEPLGLAGDRRWMVADATGECVTARTDRRLLAITARVEGPGLVLAAESERIHVEPPSGPEIPVTVHGRPLHGIPAGPEVSAWVGDIIGRTDVRLIHLSRPRALNPDHSRPGDATGFADAYPVTLASASSLRRVQDWVTEAALERGEEPTTLEMRRFRPNLVIEGGLEPFVEETWRQVRIGEVDFDVAKGIDRCVLTTVDPQTLASGHEPIRSLARHHSWDGKTWFGLQLIPRSAGLLRVGDPVQRRAAIAAS